MIIRIFKEVRGTDRKGNSDSRLSVTLQYPYALDESGEAIWVKAVNPSNRGSYRCVVCKGRMVARCGSVRTWHFAHYAAPENCSEPDALHEVAKALIIQGFNQARRSSGAYHLGRRCTNCGTRTISRDVATKGYELGSEISVVAGTRSDLVFSRGDDVVIVEIVVTHPPESNTLDRYERAGYPVFLIKPAWNNLELLRT